ncbi:unnamed protein product [Boreogadus saida]
MSRKTLAWANKEVETFLYILGEEDVYDVYVAAAAIDIRPTIKGTVGGGNATSELSWAIPPPPYRTEVYRTVQAPCSGNAAYLNPILCPCGLCHPSKPLQCGYTGTVEATTLVLLVLLDCLLVSSSRPFRSSSGGPPMFHLELIVIFVLQTFAPTPLQFPNMSLWIIQIAVVMLSLLISRSHQKKDPVLYCSACRAIVDELSYSISQVDPKKTINVGSFRLNADGTLQDKKVPLARSETYLSELLEEVCSSMSDYALYVDPDTQEKRYKRFAPRDNGGTDSFPDIQNFKFDGMDSSSALKFACETILEDLDEDIISLFSQNTQHVAEELCSGVSAAGSSPSLAHCVASRRNDSCTPS